MDTLISIVTGKIISLRYKILRLRGIFFLRITTVNNTTTLAVLYWYETRFPEPVEKYKLRDF
jgi:hypothetical protein